MRENLHLTQEQFARKMRVTATTAARWETSHPPSTRPTLQKLWKYAQRHGSTESAEVFRHALDREQDREFRRRRKAQILDADNLSEAQRLVLALRQMRDSYPPSEEQFRKIVDMLTLLFGLSPEDRRSITEEKDPQKKQ
jgi:transcriptional regulator with XRE-family HTH domain